MPTDDDRRKAARKLRELPTDMYQVEKTWQSEGFDTDCHDQTDYYQIYYVLFGCLPADNMHPYDYEELHARLADLIEPEERTCRIITTVKPLSQVQELHVKLCSSCDYVFGSEERRRLPPYYGKRATSRMELPNYCPNCGAKVVG